MYLRVIQYLLIVHLMNQKINYYRCKDCMKKFSKDLREHASKIINDEMIKMIPLITEGNMLYT